MGCLRGQLKSYAFIIRLFSDWCSFIIIYNYVITWDNLIFNFDLKWLYGLWFKGQMDGDCISTFRLSKRFSIFFY